MQSNHDDCGHQKHGLFQALERVVRWKFLEKLQSLERPFIVMWKRNSSCCAGGNVNWTAILKSHLSEPREVKDMHNVKFFNVSCKQGFWSWADYYYLQQITSQLPLCLSCLPSGNTMRTTCHPIHTKVCIIGKEPWKYESGYLHRGRTMPPLIWKKGRKIFAPWEGCWVLTLTFWDADKSLHGEDKTSVSSLITQGCLQILGLIPTLKCEHILLGR